MGEEGEGLWDCGGGVGDVVFSISLSVSLFFSCLFLLVVCFLDFHVLFMALLMELWNTGLRGLTEEVAMDSSSVSYQSLSISVSVQS